MTSSNGAGRFLACDLGAESGRLMLGTLENGKVALEELHRFPNTPVRSGESLHWNIDALFRELKVALKKAAARRVEIASISTDSWGVDYVLFNASGEMVPPTFHYRDPRTARGVERMHSLVPWEKVFAETGIQFMPLNTLYQIAAEVPERLASADKLLLIGDAFNYLLGGAPRAEESLASTTQFYNPRTKQWAEGLLNAVGVKRAQLPEIVPSGTKLGRLKPELADESGLAEIEVIATCSHDTGAAVAAVPASGSNWAYLSSGTWSLMGVELAEPLINERSRALNFTNEIGFGSSVRLLKNIIGLWIVQECRREWQSRGEDYDYAALTRMAAEARPFCAMINPSDARFLPPGGMPEKIASYCRDIGQAPPVTPGETVRCVLESLALLYRRTLSNVEGLVGHRIEKLHIVGGGSRNDLLNQFAANALQIPVIAGPVEATALGNVLIQAIALGHLPSLEAARGVVRESFEVREFVPQDKTTWERKVEEFRRVHAKT